jgi:hypothetical protein
MIYKEYIDLLDKNNIKLFDYEKRISFYNLNNYKFNYNQTGGGIKLNNKTENELKSIINVSLSSQPNLLLSLIN